MFEIMSNILITAKVGPIIYILCLILTIVAEYTKDNKKKLLLTKIDVGTLAQSAIFKDLVHLK